MKSRAPFRPFVPLARAFVVAPALLALPALTGGCDRPSGPDTPKGAEGAGPGAWDAWAPVLEGTMVDLTHPFEDEMLVWPTSDRFELRELFAGRTDEGFYYEAYNIFTPEHGGTHLDAPIHFAEGMWRTDEIPVDRLVGPGVVVDMADRARENPDYQVTPGDLREWEEEYGRIPDGAILLLSFDRARHWPDAEAYMGTARRGEEAVEELEFPGLHPDAAAWLVEERDVAAVGLDTPSIDHGPSTTFEAHQTLFRANIPAFENVANLDRLPATGSLVVALPMKVAGGSGGPLRIVAVLQD